MNETDTTKAPEPAHPAHSSRRGFFAGATQFLGFLLALLVAIPGVAFLIDPLRRRGAESRYRRLPVAWKDLQPGVPRAFPIVEERTDAWVKYPAEPVGTVWLVRQPGDESDMKVVAFTAECPHLGCAIGLAADHRSFFCPCHQSAFQLDGRPLNAIPPRGMDTLDVEHIKSPDERISVKFERFRTQSPEKTPLV